MAVKNIASGFNHAATKLEPAANWAGNKALKALSSEGHIGKQLGALAYVIDACISFAENRAINRVIDKLSDINQQENRLNTWDIPNDIRAEKLEEFKASRAKLKVTLMRKLGSDIGKELFNDMMKPAAGALSSKPTAPPSTGPIVGPGSSGKADIKTREIERSNEALATLLKAKIDGSDYSEKNQYTRDVAKAIATPGEYNSKAGDYFVAFMAEHLERPIHVITESEYPKDSGKFLKSSIDLEPAKGQDKEAITLIRPKGSSHYQLLVESQAKAEELLAKSPDRDGVTEASNVMAEPVTYQGKTYFAINPANDGDCLFRCVEFAIERETSNVNELRESLASYVLDNQDANEGVSNALKNYKIAVEAAS